MKRPYDLKYDHKADRWMIHRKDDSYGLHCGECFELCLGDQKFSCCLEYGDEWYIILHNTRFNLRIQDTYKVKL